jgi:pilus assembly protein CpaB
MADADSIAGRVTRVPVFAGDVIVPARLAPEGSGPGLEVKIAPGKRAMAVKINDVAGISGLVQPNSHVDVLVTLRNAGNAAAGIAKVFLEDMRVLSVGTKVQRGDTGKPIEATTATLEVTPAQAEQLAVAMNLGSIQLVLRGYGDPASVHTAGANVADVLAQLRAPGALVRSDGGDVGSHAARAESRRPARRRVSASSAAATQKKRTAAAAPNVGADSVVIRVYRGEQLQLHKLAPADSSANQRRDP